MTDLPKFLLALSIIFFNQSAFAQAKSLAFDSFLKNYQERNSEALAAERGLSSAERLRDQNTDLWQSRLSATPQISFLERSFDSSLQPDISNRSQNIMGTFTQLFPTGTRLEVNGQKFLEVQNPLFSSLDRSYSAKITQDLFRNAFGTTQRATARKAENDFAVAELEYLQRVSNTCEKAFTLYAETYIQQEITELLKEQLNDARKALKISKELFQNRLINKIDKLTAQSDFIDTKQQTEQALQKLINNKRLMQSFMDEAISRDFKLHEPTAIISTTPATVNSPTLSEVIARKKVQSQDLDVRRSRTDRWTDIQLGLEAGQKAGRIGFGGPLLNYNEDYLQASITVGIDFINNTEDADLKNAIRVRNNLAIEQNALQKTQKSIVTNLVDMNHLLKDQVKSTARQVDLLEEKTEIAFNQMKRAKLDFQNYLLHRNAYLNQKINYLNLKRDLWLNQFALQKEFAHKNNQFCGVNS